MRAQRNRRGFTRLDALVAGVVCVVLVLLVPVLLGSPRERSRRMVCAANLGQIGKAMFLYASDNDSNLPRAGGPTTAWGCPPNWQASSRYLAYGLAADGGGGRATISSSFYLLVKYYGAPTRLFLCPGDKGTSVFKLADGAASGTPSDFTLADAWDFGPAGVAFRSCSFSYHHPYSQHPLTTSRDPNLAVAADRNPWLRGPGADSESVAGFRPDLPGHGGTPETARLGNTVVHGRDGQNVLFLDGRVRFETRAYCGLDRDNIYTASGRNDGGAIWGVPFSLSQKPISDKDSYLINDPYEPDPYYTPQR